MDFLEKDLEQIIYESDRNCLKERGIHINGKLFRQLRLGNYGIADLIEIERVGYNRYEGNKLLITVYELKKDKVGISAFLQAVSYVNAIDHYLSLRKCEFDVEFSIVLIGKHIDKESSFCYLPEFLPSNESSDFLKVFSYSYGLDGIKFKEESGYRLIDHGFKQKIII